MLRIGRHWTNWLTQLVGCAVDDLSHLPILFVISQSATTSAPYDLYDDDITLDEWPLATCRHCMRATHVHRHTHTHVRPLSILVFNVDLPHCGIVVLWRYDFVVLWRCDIERRASRCEKNMFSRSATSFKYLYPQVFAQCTCRCDVTTVITFVVLVFVDFRVPSSGFLQHRAKHNLNKWHPTLYTLHRTPYIVHPTSR